MLTNRRLLKRSPSGRFLPAFERLEQRAVCAATSLPTVSIADASVAEGNAGSKQLSFAVTLSARATRTTTVRFSTADVTATVSGGDYSTAEGTVRFAKGATRASVSVKIRGDAAFEANETFNVRLSQPTGCNLGRSTAVGTIVDDDSPPPPPPVGSWTILVYMTGEDLNQFARVNINQMEQALTMLPAGVRFVVSWDQPTASGIKAFATGGGKQAAWRTYGRSVLRPDSNVATIASSFDLSPGERNTGDPATLVDFVKWGVAAAPASRYALVIWGHGAGFAGSNFDSESVDELTIDETVSALSTTETPSLDIVSYDSCLMGMAEVGAELAQKISGVFVASQATVPGAGFVYTTAFDSLKVANPAAVPAADVAAGMVKSYGTRYRNNTLSAVGTAGYAGLTSALRSFVNASAALTPTEWLTVRSAAAAIVDYMPPSGGLGGFRDLGQFMTNVAASSTLPPSLKAAAANVQAALAGAVLSKTKDPRSSSGVSIYLPSTKFFDQYETLAKEFCSATNWQTFAKALASQT